MKIWLVWATNVGKSTLFNRLIWQFRAIVTDIPGTTRDILQHETDLEKIGKVTFLDSPGLLDFKEEREYIKQIIDEADILLFVIDDTVGIWAKEQNIFWYIMDQNKKQNTILVVNKIDVKYRESESELAISDYHDLGFTHIIGISAKKGRNLDFLQEEMQEIATVAKKKMSEAEVKVQEAERPKGIPIAIIWKPNVGKSTLLNKLFGKDVSKVENIPNTTRDYIVANVTHKNRLYTFYDTAGISKRGKMHEIVKISYNKTMDMIKYVRPIVIFMIDATDGISHRDMTIFQEVQIQALPIMFCVNKSDLVDKKELQKQENAVVANLDFAKYIPVLNISAKTGQWLDKIFEIAKDLRKESEKRIDTGKLNKIISAEYISRPPRFPRNRICKILYITQTDINAPTFVAFINHKDRANFAFKKRLENTIRRHFKFIGTPIVIKFKDREEKKEEKIAENDGEQIDQGGRTAKKTKLRSTTRELMKSKSPSKKTSRRGRSSSSNKVERVGRQ